MKATASKPIGSAKKMPTQRIATASIGMPQPYIRGKYNTERINMWGEQVRATAEEAARQGGTVESNLPAAWFLPKISVMVLAKPETIEFTGPDRKKHQKTVGYRILDGVHRYMTAGQVGLDALECEVLPTMTPAEAFAFQFKSNNEGPLPFDRDTRDGAIRQMGKLDMKLHQIAATTGISEAQISRILSGKTKSSAELRASRSKGGKARKGTRKGAKSKGGYDCADFFAAAKLLSRQAASHYKVLKEYLGEHDKVWEPCQDLITSLEKMREEEK